MENKSKKSRSSGGLRTQERHKVTSAELPLVTIITVVRNGEAHLEEAIGSVLGQSYSNIEYIIIDGVSTDSTLEIIQKYEDSIDYWISEPDNGIYDAMNKGIALAQGDLIGILNSDDRYLDDTIQRIVETALAYPKAEVFHGNLRLIRKNGIEEIRQPRLIQEGYRPFLMPVNHPTVFVRSNCYTVCGTFDTTFRTAADFDLMLHFLYDCRISFQYLDLPLTCMREGGESDRYNPQTYADIIKILKRRNQPRLSIIRFKVWYLWLQLNQYGKRFRLVRAIAPLYYKLKRSGF